MLLFELGWFLSVYFSLKYFHSFLCFQFYFFCSYPYPSLEPSGRQANLFASILTFWKRKWNHSRTALFVCFFVGGGLESTPLSSCIYKKVVFLNAIIVDFVESVANQHLCTCASYDLISKFLNGSLEYRMSKHMAVAIVHTRLFS